MRKKYGSTVGSNKLENSVKQIHCGNCYNVLEHGLGVSTILMEDGNSGLVNRVHVSEATAYIYGISVEELRDISGISHSSSNISRAETQIVFCFQCATLLSENYKAHKRFEIGRQQLSKCVYGDHQSTLQLEASNDQSNLVLNSLNGHSGDKESLNENDNFEDFNFDNDNNFSDIESDNEEKVGISNTNIKLHETIVKSSGNKTVPQPKELFIKLDRLSDEEVQRLCGKKAKSILNDNNKHERFLRWSRRHCKTIRPQTKNKTDKSVMCHICHEVLKDRGSFRFHLLKVHRNIKQESVKAQLKNICKKFMYSDRQSRVKFSSKLKIKCKICEILIRDRSMSRHMKIHTESPINCTICGKLVKNRPRLKRHMAVKHNDFVSCRICRKELTMYTLKNHIEVKHENKVYKCEHCPKIFRTYTGRYTHNKLHLNPEAYKERLKEESIKRRRRHREIKKFKLPCEKIECEICKKLISSERMDIHIQISHTDSNAKANCKICGRLQNSSYLPIHMRIQHQDAPVNCDLCGKLMKNSFKLKMHMEFTHGDSVSCRICKKEMTLARFKKHKVQKHSTKIKFFKCEHCSKEFRSKYGYDLHIIAHVNREAHEERLRIRRLKKNAARLKCIDELGEDGGQYICAHCGKAFTDMDGLTAHEKRHAQEKDFTCNLCGKQLTTKDGLLTHLGTHSTERQYKCDECGKMFANKKYWYQHVQNHKEIAKNGEKSVKCEECGKLFMHSLSLSKHKRRYHRTDVKTNICKYCDQRFPFPKAKNHHEKNCKDKPTG